MDEQTRESYLNEKSENLELAIACYRNASL